jgi:hypothetical protein
MELIHHIMRTRHSQENFKTISLENLASNQT